MSVRMSLSSLGGERLAVAREVGLVDAARLARRSLLGRRRQLGLVCDLVSLPAIGTPVELLHEEPRAFTGFRDLADRLTGRDRLEILWYARLADAGVPTLAVHRGPDGEPLFSTWLFDRDAQEALGHRFADGFHPLGEAEVMVEGVLTFPAARGRGLAVRGLATLLTDAATRGAKRAWVYPYVDNPRGLRLFARVGFVPVHARTEWTVLGREIGTVATISPADEALWASATRATRAHPDP